LRVQRRSAEGVVGAPRKRILPTAASCELKSSATASGAAGKPASPRPTGGTTRTAKSTGTSTAWSAERSATGTTKAITDCSRRAGRWIEFSAADRSKALFEESTIEVGGSPGDCH